MDIEHEVKVIAMLPPEHFQAEVEKLDKEGWKLVPGVRPVAIYHVVRDKAQAIQVPHTGRGTLTIDDSKIGILRDGKII